MMLRAAFALMLALPVAASPLPAPAPLTMPAMPLHDPWIVADAATHTYWLFTTNQADMTGDTRLGIMAYTSRDLTHWTRPAVVFTLPKGTWANDGAWAPEVHCWRGRWYLFTTFHNESAKLARPGTHRRGTVLAVADRPGGPFTLLRDGDPIAPKDLMTLDGTLHVDRAGRPWLVYAHEWVQARDGTIEALPLDATLKAAGDPRLLFRASDASWASGRPQQGGDRIYVTDGPELFRTRTGRLLMLWSSYDDRGAYVQGVARSRSGELAGPWEQLPPLVRADSGHGMLFRRFDGELMMVLHRPFNTARGKLYEMRDTGDSVAVVREASELDGETHPTHGG